jgi:hypothetical protein
LVIGGGIGAFFFPFSISALAKGIGIEQALWFYPAIGLAMALAAVLVLTREIPANLQYCLSPVLYRGRLTQLFSLAKEKAVSLACVLPGTRRATPKIASQPIMGSTNSR